MSTESRWANAVRVLALISVGLGVVAVLEGRAARQARAELQQLRTERDEHKAGEAGVWTKQSLEEFGQAVHRLHDTYIDSSDGLGRADGLCANGQLDEKPIATYVVGAFLTARAAGKSMDRALEDMNQALRASDEYRAVHPTAR